MRYAVRGNLKKYHKRSICISRFLRAENVSPRVVGMFYKATVQAILLFGSETWFLSPTAMKQLEGIHLRAAWRMAKEHTPCLVPGTDTWQYPATEEVFEEVALYSVEHYIR